MSCYTWKERGGTWVAINEHNVIVTYLRWSESADQWVDFKGRECGVDIKPAKVQAENFKRNPPPQEDPAWVEMEPGLWWCGSWSIREIDGYGFSLTVNPNVTYGPFPTLEAVKQKASEVAG